MLTRLDLFLLIFGRMAGFCLTAVPFSSRTIPTVIKVWLAVLVSYLIFLISQGSTVAIASNAFGYLIQFVSELLIGCIIGFITQITFAAFQMAGQLLDMQIGFAMMTVIDPQNGTQIPLLGNFQYILAIMVFLTVNGHHYLLQALAGSYRLLPIGGGLNLSGDVYQLIFIMARDIFVTAFQIALPVLGALFITNLILGVIARVVPQINIFIVALPLQIGVGIGVLMIMVPLLVWAGEVQFNHLYHQLTTLLSALRG